MKSAFWIDSMLSDDISNKRFFPKMCYDLKTNDSTAKQIIQWKHEVILAVACHCLKFCTGNGHVQ